MNEPVCIATIEQAHAEEVREALAASDVEAELVAVVPMTQVEFVRHRHRPMVDVRVAREQEAAARAVLEAMALEGERAAEAEAEVPQAHATANVQAGGTTKETHPPGRLGVALVVGLIALVIASAVVFGLDRLLALGSERHPAAFGVVGGAFLVGVYLVLRRRE